MRMKKLMILAVTALALAACAKTYEVKEVAPPAIGFGSWTDVMTRAPLTAFANNDEFDVYGFKWNAGPANQTNVFTGDDVKYNSSTDKWSYSPKRYWDNNFDNYTFYAAFPKDQLAAEATENDYAQRGLFITNELTYNGSDEVFLVAKKKDVAKEYYGNEVQLEFKHTGSLVDIKFKKHSELADAVVAVTSIALSDIQTKGTYTVAGYDGTTNDPVGKEVSSVAGLGWELAATPVTNATPAAAPYLNSSSVSLAAATGTTTETAGELISNLVVMPQVLPLTSGPKITLTYTITTGTGGSAQTSTFTDKVVYFGAFDLIDPDPTDKQNADPRISSWMPNVHYTYYITINANAIEFTASIDSWATPTTTGHYYLVN